MPRELIGVMKSSFRGYSPLLEALADVSVHMTALKIRVRHGMSGPKYNDLIGPWEHVPGHPVDTKPAWEMQQGPTYTAI